MSDEKLCPACGKGETESYLSDDAKWKRRTVSHLACAIAEHEARLQARAEVDDLRRRLACMEPNDTEAACRALADKLAHEEESNHISIAQWTAWEERAEQAEADLMFRTEQRDDLLKRLERAEAENDQWAERWAGVAKERNAAEAEVERVTELKRIFKTDALRLQAESDTNRRGWKDAAGENERLRGVLRALFIREHDFWLGWDEDREREFTEWLADLARRYEEAHHE